jgi:hypothetical protein
LSRFATSQRNIAKICAVTLVSAQQMGSAPSKKGEI